MILRSGMSGDSVKRVQELLSARKLYAGPIDSLFGGGLESAVKSYQKQQNISPTGLVDGTTWTQMFPGEPARVSTFVKTSLLDRCLALTGTFETSKYPPDSFLGLTGDFDGMGISFGVCQWNIGQGTLQPLLQQMFEEHADVAQSIFHEHFDTVTALRSAPITDQLAFTRSIQTKGQVNEPWKGMLLTLGRTPEFQRVQADHASSFYNQALQLCGEYGLTSERAVALMFDIVTQNHSIGPLVKAAILADFSQLGPNDPDNELAKMRIVANRRAAAAKPEYRDDVRLRKLTIANGAGSVHGVAYDLADMYCITLNPFAAVSAAAS
ncbi:MAG: peptidoglycan-binding domain-containing protein [Bryobacteraceae bacterium]